MDKAAADQLKLYIDNDGDLHRQQTTSILKNLMTRRARGALSIFGDEPGILVQRSRIDVQLRGTRTFIRDALRVGRRSTGAASRSPRFEIPDAEVTP